jgi:hypothetical protein
MLVISATFVAGLGCNSNSSAELAKARADAEAARAEAATLRSEFESLRAKSDPFNRDRDLKLARSVAEGFLHALLQPNVDELHGFCTPDEQKRANVLTVPKGKVSFAINGELMGVNGREAIIIRHDRFVLWPPIIHHYRDPLQRIGPRSLAGRCGQHRKVTETYSRFIGSHFSRRLLCFGRILSLPIRNRWIGTWLCFSNALGIEFRITAIARRA